MAIKRLEVSNPAYSPNNVQTVTVHSSNLQRRHDVTFYNVNTRQKDAPIIILMHGVYGNNWVWMNLGGIDKVYENIRSQLSGIDFILAMPSDGGFHDGSAYLPLKNADNYEKWIMQDVLDAVIATVHNATQKSRLYLCGLSMGGYGALRLGCKYANLVKGISAHSAITELTEMSNFVDTPLAYYECENSNEANILHWAKLNKAQLPPIRFDCGENDELFAGNLKFSQTLTNASIEHVFEQFAGGHQWEYWHQHVAASFLFFAEIERTI